jgi:hypothetical protein
MKTEFDKTIDKMLTSFGHRPKFVGNFDDTHSGFEFNPQPNVLIQFKYNMNAKDFAGEYCVIQAFVIQTWSATLSLKNLFNGPFVLHEDGNCNYGFYETLLRNYDNIG